jgi:hypothetical protein
MFLPSYSSGTVQSYLQFYMLIDHCVVLGQCHTTTLGACCCRKTPHAFPKQAFFLNGRTGVASGDSLNGLTITHLPRVQLHRV